MEIAIIKLQEELDYENHLLERGFYKNKTEFDSDGTEQDCKNRIESYQSTKSIIMAIVKTADGYCLYTLLGTVNYGTYINRQVR